MKFIFIFLNLILSVLSIQVFNVTAVNYVEARCVYEESYYKFIINGLVSEIYEDINLDINLAEPAYTKAKCTIYAPDYPINSTIASSEMFCTVDGSLYDLSGAQPIKLPKKLPNYEGLEINNWKSIFQGNEHGTITSSSNCNSGSFNGVSLLGIPESIKFFGCFASRNNFSFDLKRSKGKLEEIKSDDFYFKLDLVQSDVPITTDEVKCVIPVNEKKNDDIYTVSCSLALSGTLYLNDIKIPMTVGTKERTVYILASSLPPISIESCP